MKSKDVRKLLGISRVTLYTYVKLGKIKVHQLDNGYYEFDNESVYKFIGIDKRKMCYMQEYLLINKEMI